MMHSKTVWIASFASASLLAIVSLNATAAVVDCNKIMNVKKSDAFATVDAADVQQCRLRGWDPPTEWKRDGGKSAGVKASGSGGFSYGSVQAPEAPQNYVKRGIKASVKKDVITRSCSFPPRFNVSLTNQTVSIPKGSCYDFLNGLFKSKDDGTGTDSTLTGIPPNDSCPTETDSTGVYGTKKPIASGGSIPLSCGGMLPMTTTNIILNKNPTNFVSTENGSYYIWFYQKGGSGFTGTVAPVKLPSYLCLPDPGEGGGMTKSVDLTPPIAQIITYDPSVGEINIRLQSRASMTVGFIPPYNQDDPEKYLVIPVDGNGVPQVPADCADENAFFKVPTAREDISVQTATADGCTGFSSLSAYSGGLPKPVACPGPDVQPTAIFKPGPTSVAIPPMPCADYNALLAKCGTTGTPASVDASCDTISLYPKGTFGGVVCDGKMQTGVLNRANLYYPPGSTAVLYPVQGRTALMAQTTDNTQFFTQQQTIFELQKTAPPLKFNEGGLITLKNGSILIMNPPATVNAATGQVTLTGGGQLVSGGGTQLVPTLPEGTVYTIPANLIKMPMHIRVSRSVTFPAGFMMPTMPKIGTDASTPYLRLPADAPPPT